MRRLLAAALIPVLVGGLTSCKVLDVCTRVGTTIGVATGALTAEQAQSLSRVSSAVGKTFDTITPEQEYYIGRTVGATILRKYDVYDNRAVTAYLNTLGQTLAAHSDKPETFSGYHFLALDTKEINAFAAPGGFVFVSRGLLKCCKTEDALAAVLAHEIGHVQHLHGLQAIKKNRLTSAGSVALAEGAKQFGSDQVASLTGHFEGVVTDIAHKMIDNGYSRGFERQADKAAVTIMTRVGYDPAALKLMLTEMEKHLGPDSGGFGKTHPSPSDRIKEIESLVDSHERVVSPAERRARFARAMKAV